MGTWLFRGVEQGVSLANQSGTYSTEVFHYSAEPAMPSYHNGWLTVTRNIVSFKDISDNSCDQEKVFIEITKCFLHVANQLCFSGWPNFFQHLDAKSQKHLAFPLFYVSLSIETLFVSKVREFLHLKNELFVQLTAG